MLKIKERIVNKVLNPGDTLGERTIKGGIWIVSLRIFNRLFQFARTVVLARLLAPDDFGLFGVALLSLSLLETFSQTGFWQALIQKKGDVKSYLNTAWTIGLIRGFTIAIILFLAAPGAAAFFNAPAAEWIVKVIGLSIILHNLTNISVIYFDKELEFHKYFFYTSMGTIADFAMSISIALVYQSVWALVLGRLAGDLVRCVVSYIIIPYRPRPFIDLQKAKELFSFGKWILGSSILIFFTSRGDDLVVGKFLGVAALGFYQVAFRISTLISTEISRPLMKVTFPAYSKLQDDFPKLREAYLKILDFTAFVTLPIAGLIFATAGNFTISVLGEKWRPIIPIIMILVFRAISHSLRVTLAPVTKAIGHPEIETKVTFIQVLILAVSLYPAAKFFGLSGVAVVVAFQLWATFPVLLYLLLPKIQLGFGIFLKTISSQLLATLIMAGATYFLQTRLVYSLTTWILEVFFGAFIYLGLVFIFSRDKFKTLSYIKNRIY